MQLHDFYLSGNCYKVRLFLGLIGQPAELLTVDLPHGAQKHPEFLALNPRGQVPVLVDNGQPLVDSQAILVYLARRYADAHWYPLDAVAQAQIAGWLSLTANEIHNGVARARIGLKFGRQVDLEDAQARGRQVLELVNAHLTNRTWLVGEQPTIADVAVYPYLAMAEEGGLELAPYPYLNSWLARIRALPGYLDLPHFHGARRTE
ncbi:MULTISPECIES: glutathione S-transferase family protein [unclassified Pseudomonas]|uniref:glutathione S-transferase family protein n=1 Tax=unclassified Pseudomonas TaxID=196821 RepID=UPI00129EE006|nr:MULTISPECIES: glutathione S-transferase family protein [unclassified Pseudomonas]MDH4652955.1 glutathione S-transferase family protein [Pseudomonas sp. BN606]MRK23130.1 glutathione S-transferase family protein [Pseudomonas sp. JG-B]